MGEALPKTPMTPQEALDFGRRLVRMAENSGLEVPEALQPTDFREYSRLVADIARSYLSKSQKNRLAGELKRWAPTWRILHEEYEEFLRKDPMSLYQPKHKISTRFHESDAYVRYYMAGNGTSKTTTANAEIYSCLTRQTLGGVSRCLYPNESSAVSLISLGFSSYLSGVFKPKWLIGESSNILSPIFPEDGKWFHSFDKKENVLTVGCPACAEAGKPKACWHSKSTLKVYSDTGGWEAFQGASFRLVVIDEHIDKGFFLEALERTKRGGVNGRIIVAGTPLFGHTAWEVQMLLKRWEGPEEENRFNPIDPNSRKWVEVFKVNQYEAGFITAEEIEAKKRSMTKYEIKSRIYGEPMERSEHPVFDEVKLEQLELEFVKQPVFGRLAPKMYMEENRPLSITEISQASDMTFTGEVPDDPAKFTGLRIWEPPVPGCQYIIPADTAMGIAPSTHDASCAHVLKLVDKGDGHIHLEQVAQFYGWLNPIQYAIEAVKLGYYYNTALLIPEYTGIGRAFVLHLKQLYYPNLFQDSRQPEFVDYQDDGRMGVDTNQTTKPLMVSSLQNAINQGWLVIRDEYTIREMLAFEQTRTPLGYTRYMGADGSRDDRVMAMAFGTYAAFSQADIFSFILTPQPEESKAHWKPHRGDPFTSM